MACCINIWLRMYAEKRRIPLSGVTAEVRLDRRLPQQTVFEYAVDLQGPLSQQQRHELKQQIDACPVSQTLLKRISVREMNREDKP